MGNLQKIQDEVSRRVLIYRRLERFVQGDGFCAAFKDADFDTVMKLINELDEFSLDRYAKTNLPADLSDASLRQLRDIASKYKIPYYTVLNKLELIRSINESRRKNESRNTSGGCPGNEIRQNNIQIVPEESGTGAKVS